jgi:hypothetical protein
MVQLDCLDYLDSRMQAPEPLERQSAEDSPTTCLHSVDFELVD